MDDEKKPSAPSPNQKPLKTTILFNLALLLLAVGASVGIGTFYFSRSDGAYGVTLEAEYIDYDDPNSWGPTFGASHFIHALESLPLRKQALATIQDKYPGIQAAPKIQARKEPSLGSEYNTHVWIELSEENQEFGIDYTKALLQLYEVSNPTS